MLRARASLQQDLAGQERPVRQLAQEEPVCRRLMSLPGVGAVVALTRRSAVDDPARFMSSGMVMPWVGIRTGRSPSWCKARDGRPGVSYRRYPSSDAG